ncbi:hypothetical protein M378DRAFT_167966 [Amanita muscaria Koide BX008]|uniref:Uncharacterized protein n=1 Tax=Amanita muscaria (strain Koide BX008) TaxID=946122 RepID=A0A0C2WW72_AMAMK|nr:hypothetical protein M378DRAFT_167966 [Amanita muscaria Koide BX008]
MFASNFTPWVHKRLDDLARSLNKAVKMLVYDLPDLSMPSKHGNESWMCCRMFPATLEA